MSKPELSEHGPTHVRPGQWDFQDPAAPQHSDSEFKKPTRNPRQSCQNLPRPLQLWTQDVWWWGDIQSAPSFLCSCVCVVFLLWLMKAVCSAPAGFWQALTGLTQILAALLTLLRWCATSLLEDRPAWSLSLFPRLDLLLEWSIFLGYTKHSMRCKHSTLADQDKFGRTLCRQWTNIKSVITYVQIENGLVLF